jgi:hypothetical protein
VKTFLFNSTLKSGVRIIFGDTSNSNNSSISLLYKGNTLLPWLIMLSLHEVQGRSNFYPEDYDNTVSELTV